MQNEQILSTINTLTEKFGMTVDWNNYIKYEFITSYIWLGIGIALLITAIILISRGRKLSKKYDEYEELYIAACDEDVSSEKAKFYKEEAEGASAVSFQQILIGVLLGIVGVCMVMSQVFDIIRCCTAPEMQMFSYIKHLITQ